MIRTGLAGLALAALLGGCAAPGDATEIVSVSLSDESNEAFWSCPEGYEVKEGLNTGFPSEGLTRAFVVHPAKGVTTPAPAWVPLTGTVESTNANLNNARSGANALMADKGYTVIGPVRQCGGEDPNVGFAECNGPGSDGWNWKPWNDGRAASPEGDKWKNDAGPDSRFFEAMVRCVGTKFPLDESRLFIGGISAGGTITNRALTFNSDFWAGGMPISGEWYVTDDDGSAVSFMNGRQRVAEAPEKIHQGRIGPYPLHDTLGSMIVITVWGGDKDTWDCGPPIGLCADYRPSTQAGSNYFSSMPNIVHVACSADHGHMWPQENTQAFNLWALTTMASHPKGAVPEDFVLTNPPAGYSCRLGRYTDHY
jgi:hypothetical protein